jgi:ubiquinone/menaquinone biosynthesis C-methylase UbiE/predicted metal-dependent enzyme (double-stranded beta helix superfamily)
MDNILRGLRQFTPETLTWDTLGEFVKQINPDAVSYHDELPPLLDGEHYTRNILSLEPLECVVLHWPPGAESAIHFHEGFWGFVLVLDGTCDNVEYEHKSGTLRETHLIRAQRGGVLDEPDGTIHKIVNPSSTEHLVTVHFYTPALDTLDGLKLYDTKTGTIAVLNEHAPSASLQLPESCFHSFQPGAFTYLPLAEEDEAHTHRTVPLLPKPAPDEIREMIMGYYQEQALQYDDFDRNHPSRKKYTERINALISEDLRHKPDVNRLLAIACGTGRRALDIRESSGHDYQITCVDLSEEMCCQASERGVDTRVGPWLQVDVPLRTYDAVTFLYAFGHLPTHEERKLAMDKIAASLKPGGVVYLDVFNLEDENEWGPKAIESFDSMNLSRYGYERGDVFYQKVGGTEIAFLHYFTEDALRSLATQSGLEVAWIKHIGYVHRSGEELTDDTHGSLLLKATLPKLVGPL